MIKYYQVVPFENLRHLLSSIVQLQLVRAKNYFIMADQKLVTINHRAFLVEKFSRWT